MKQGDLVRLKPHPEWVKLAAEEDGYLWVVIRVSIGTEHVRCKSIADGCECTWLKHELEQVNEAG